MSDTLPNVILPSNVAVDLYAATGILVGNQITVQNNSNGDVRLYIGATAPVLGVAGSILLRHGASAINDVGDTGAWAWSATPASVNVREV